MSSSSATNKNDFRFERFEEYYGTIETVQKIITQCQSCGSKLVLSHLPDYKNLIVQETARCIECGVGNRKVIHILN
jgi:phosphohistidine phosphatase SixA